jgi:hypothetical protein
MFSLVLKSILNIFSNLSENRIIVSNINPTRKPIFIASAVMTLPLKKDKVIIVPIEVLSPIIKEYIKIILFKGEFPLLFPLETFMAFLKAFGLNWTIVAG